MKIEDFVSGTWESGYKYKYFVPSTINHSFSWEDDAINSLLENASLKLGELNSFSRFVPDIDMFIKMHIYKEAVVSSWIGGASIADAVYVPPAADKLGELMSDFEKFLNNEEINVPHLIKIAIAHYQFETIHPFLDGNGRVGRLLITLYFVASGILEKPLLYLSAFFEKNRSLYYDKLTMTREKNDLKQWIKYFLVGIAQTAEEGTFTLQKIMQLEI